MYTSMKCTGAVFTIFDSVTNNDQIVELLNKLKSTFRYLKFEKKITENGTYNKLNVGSTDDESVGVADEINLSYKIVCKSKKLYCIIRGNLVHFDIVNIRIFLSEKFV